MYLDGSLTIVHYLYGMRWLYDIDTTESEFKAEMYLQYSWVDNRLTWI